MNQQQGESGGGNKPVVMTQIVIELNSEGGINFSASGPRSDHATVAGLLEIVKHNMLAAPPQPSPDPGRILPAAGMPPANRIGNLFSRNGR